MLNDFGYAQARTQARHGERLTAAQWRALESADDLSQYLHALRATSLSYRVHHFSASSSPHLIERSLRGAWRDEVDDVRRWVPRDWHDAVTWADWLPDLPAIAYLRTDGPVHTWMRDDPQLSAFALTDPEARRAAFRASPFADLTRKDDFLDWWTTSWLALWPESTSGQTVLRDLIEDLRSLRDSMQEQVLRPNVSTDLRDDIEGRIVRIMHLRLRQPVVVFCHLVLTALELWRLRGGLIGRAMFNDVLAEQGS